MLDKIINKIQHDINENNVQESSSKIFYAIEQTSSAVEWLNSNSVDISCYQILLYKFKEDIIIDVKKCYQQQNIKIFM